MASKLTVDQFAAEVARALGARLVALLLYGSWARGTHVPDRSDVNTLLICDTVDDALFATLAPAMRAWTRAGHPAPLILTEREWRPVHGGLPLGRSAPPTLPPMPSTSCRLPRRAWCWRPSPRRRCP